MSGRVKWADLSERERDALVAERVMGACVHDFDEEVGDYRFLARARKDWQEEFGVEPPDNWRPYDWDEDWRAVCRKCDREWSVYTGNSLRPRADQDVARYTTDIAAALEVVEKMRDSGWAWTADFRQDTGLVAWRFHRRLDIHRADTYTAPEAICIAALRAVGVEVET